MITQQDWDSFSSHTKYISQKFNRGEILQVLCKKGLDGGLPLDEQWPQGVADYAFKMRFRKTNNNKGSVFVFNDFCVNNDPLSEISYAYREYNASIFGLEYAIAAKSYLSTAISDACALFNDQIATIIRKRAAFLDDLDARTQRLKEIGARVSGIELKKD